MSPWEIGMVLLKITQLLPTICTTPRKNSLIKDVTFLNKSYGEWSKVEKPVLIPKNYDGLDDEEEIKMASTNKDNNNGNILRDSENDDEAKKNFFEEWVNDEIKVTPKTTLNPKMVCAVKNLQASYNNDANNIFKQTVQEKVQKKIVFFVIDLAVAAFVTEDTKSTEE